MSDGPTCTALACSFLPHSKNPHQIGFLMGREEANDTHTFLAIPRLLPSIIFFINFVAMAAAGSSSDSVGSGFGGIISGESELTPLQKHVAFFDRNNDGVIYPVETYQGFRAIGCGVVLSSTAAFLINTLLAPKTRTGIFQSPLFPIYLKNIKKGIHGSDSGVYDTEGRFVPAKFEEIFDKHAHSNANALTSKELLEMLKSNRVPYDYLGWIASWTEWKILFFLCKDKNGLLQKETVRAVYDGSLFLQMEKHRSSIEKRT